MIGDTICVKCRKSAKSIRFLGIVWNNNQIPIESKTKLCDAMPVNLLLWGSENWSGRKSDLKLIEVIHLKSLRRLLKKTMKSSFLCAICARRKKVINYKSENINIVGKKDNCVERAITPKRHAIKIKIIV